MITHIAGVRDGAAVCFFDIDGTLIRTSKESGTVDEAPLPEVAEALRAFVDDGNVALISTGRGPAVINPHIRELPFAGMVAVDGAYVELAGQALVNRTLPQELLRAFCEEVIALRLCCLFEGCDVFWRLAGRPKDWQNNDPVYYSPEELFRENPAPGVGKIIVQDDDWDVWRSQTKLAGRFDIYDAGQRTYELVPPGSSKGVGARLLLDQLPFRPGHVMCFGDSMNDLPVFDVCDVRVAMGNAPDEVKAQATHVCASVYEAGVASGLAELDHLWR